MKETFVIEVEVGAGLPYIGDEFHISSLEDGVKYIMEVHAIKKLSWNEKKELVVEVEDIKRVEGPLFE
ncbi:hypothetical protein [Bacillus sp. NPDC094106]|uniref:hypothetical protein n=1 Tax=Bacillus sp. NPDC094106 TaxID=3363949 RepID=UPI00381B27FF